MKQTLILTPETAFEIFQQGHLGFVVPEGLLMLDVPNDPTSCVLITTMHETLWKGHAENPEAIKMMERATAFALIERHGIENPYGDIDFSAYNKTLMLDDSPSDQPFAAYPEHVQEAAEEEVQAFLDGRIGYRVHNGVLKVIEPADPDMCVLEVAGRVMWYGNAFSDEAHAMIEASTEIITLRLDPVGQKPLQA